MTDSWTPTQIQHLETLLTDRDSRILDDLEHFRALTTRLIQRLHFPAGDGGTHASVPTATRLANRILLRLESNGFVARIDRRIGGSLRGSAGQTWHLAAAGERLLRARRDEPGRRRFVTPSYAFLAHTLAVAEVAVRLREGDQQHSFDLLELTSEPACWRPFQGPLGLVTLKSDLFAVIANSEVEAHILIEVDRATEHLPAVIKKCRTYQQYRQTGLEQAESGIFPAVLWIAPDVQRSNRLRAALRAERDLPSGLFTICEADHAIDVIASFLTPTTPHRKEVSHDQSIN